MIKIGLLIYPQCLPTGLLAGLDFFNAANAVLGKKKFSAKLVGLKKTPVVCAHDQELTPELTVGEFNPEIIVVPGFWMASSDEASAGLEQNSKLQLYLNTLPKNKVLWSYCAGVLFHAKTGRFHGKRATATWWLMQNVEKNFPSVKWEANKTLVETSKDVTASGANGYFQLYENALSSLANERVLSEVQRYLMTPHRLEKNSPFYQLEIASSTNKKILKIRKLIEITAACNVSASVVADSLGLSQKTLSRYFEKELSWTPSAFFRMIKLNQAAELLTTTDLSVSEICERLGFVDESNFRRSFKKAVQLTPGEYKNKFKRESA